MKNGWIYVCCAIAWAGCGGDGERMTQLEQEVAAARSELTSLRQEVDGLKQEFEQLKRPPPFPGFPPNPGAPPGDAPIGNIDPNAVPALPPGVIAPGNIPMLPQGTLAPQLMPNQLAIDPSLVPTLPIPPEPPPSR